MSNYYGKIAESEILTDTNKNAYDFMDISSREYSDLYAMTYFGTKITYEKLKNTINLYANKLKKYGLQKGDRISIILPNIPELVFYKYAAWKLGIVVNLIEPRFNPLGIEEMINMCKSKLIVTTSETYNDKIVKINGKLPAENIVLINPTNYMCINNFKNILAKAKFFNDELLLREKNNDSRIIFSRDFEKNVHNEMLNSVYDENMPASVIFTSGTSGFPKGAVFTHDAYNIKTKQISYALPKIFPGDNFLAAIPFFAAYGSFAGMHNSLVKGMNMQMIPKFKTEEFGDLICKYNIQTAIGVPKHWDEFQKEWQSLRKKYKIHDLSFLKYPVTGGDIISDEVVDACNKLFEECNSDAKLVVGYGSTETSGPICTTVNDPEYDDSKTTGVLFPGVDYVLLDEETHEIKDNINKGEIAISDPAAMKGYIDNKDATDDITIINNGKKYYNMGDLVKINEKGMLYFEGRTKRAIMRPDGHTVHTLPIEQALMNSGKVNSVCVVGIKRKNEYSGTIPIAFIVLKDNVEITDDLIMYLDEISLNQLPERNRAHAFVFVDKLPYTLMGKVDYKTLEKSDIEELDLNIVDHTFLTDKKDVRKRIKNN